MSRIVDIIRPVTEHLTYRARCGVAAGLKRRGGLGFLPRSVTAEERFIREMDFTGMVVYDVGAYEGLFTIRFASTARRVFTFEPHPWCQAQTATNVMVNGFENVKILPVALGCESAMMTLSYPAAEPARSSIDPNIQDVLRRGWKDVRSIEVRVWPLDELAKAQGLEAPDFIKIDAEGAECEVLLGANKTLVQHHPALYIELHGDTESRVRRIVSGLGYEIKPVDEMHLYCVTRVADNPAGHRDRRPRRLADAGRGV